MGDGGGGGVTDIFDANNAVGIKTFVSGGSCSRSSQKKSKTLSKLLHTPGNHTPDNHQQHNRHQHEISSSLILKIVVVVLSVFLHLTSIF
jgi:hypothetical protein